MITNKKSKGRDANKLYKVDPKELSIEVCYISSADQSEEYITTFESFAYEKVESQSDIQGQKCKSPAHAGGALFFRTEEEAQEYVRRQIGM